MTSFVLQETVNYNAERGSKTYCCMLDAAAAFDTVWHDGLFFKIYNSGINGRLWRVLRSAYKHVKSAVFFDGYLSTWFNVHQSVRQGGVLSAWLYIIFMNELPELLESKRIGAFIGNNYYGCPMQADDVALIALTKSDLNKMMNLSYQYSCKWRYTLNPSKSVVLVFGESLSRHNRLSKNRHWKLGEDPVSENTEHRHVGILLSTTLKNTEKISVACQKMRSCFFALVGSGLKPGTTSPLTLLKLFKSVCLPRALYGCELMTNLTRSETNMLEVTYRFCLKYMQNISKRTKTNMCIASLGVTNVECIIDKYKLLFFRRLCTSPFNSSVKKLVLNRLMCYNVSELSVYKGFVNDVMRLVHKYSLYSFIEQFMNEGYFVPKRIWKHLVNRSVVKHHEEQWHVSVLNDDCYNRFISVHNSCTEPLLVWKAALRYPHKTPELCFLARLCVTTLHTPRCTLCNLTCTDFATHLFCVCSKVNEKRERFWNYISNNYDITLEVELFNKSDEDFVNCILGGKLDFFQDNLHGHLKFITSCAAIWFVKL